MNVNAVSSSSRFATNVQTASAQPRAGSQADPKTREAFEDFVGQTFYGEMLKAMRKTVGNAAYFNGGQAEKIFQQQLDQVLAEKLSGASAEQFSGPMYDLFSASRR